MNTDNHFHNQIIFSPTCKNLQVAAKIKVKSLTHIIVLHDDDSYKLGNTFWCFKIFELKMRKKCFFKRVCLPKDFPMQDEKVKHLKIRRHRNSKILKLLMERLSHHIQHCKRVKSVWDLKDLLDLTYILIFILEFRSTEQKSTSICITLNCMAFSNSSKEGMFHVEFILLYKLTLLIITIKVKHANNLPERRWNV